MGKTKIQSLSASSRWLVCSKSLEYNKEFNANANTIKGNLIHEVSALRLEEIFLKKDNKEKIKKLKAEDYVDEKDPTLKAKWDSMCDKISDAYIEYAIRVYTQYKPYKVEIEKRVDLTFYGFQKYGFIDLVMTSEYATIIIDLKTGRTKIETEGNTQMLMYSIAEIQTKHKNNEAIPNTYVFSICQPIINNVSMCQYTLQDINNWYENQSAVMEEIINDDLHFRPTKDACKFCDHRKVCSERIKQGVI